MPKYLPQMGNETQRRYLFVAIDRATRWVFIQIKSHKSAEATRSFVAALHKACPIRITRILSDNAKEFTDRLFGGRQRNATGEHEFDQLCTALGIAHRLTPPRRVSFWERIGRALGIAHRLTPPRRPQAWSSVSTTGASPQP